MMTRYFYLLILINCIRLNGFGQASDLKYMNYRSADSIASLYPKHSLKNIRLLADKLTLPLHTEEEKFRSIYKWICNNIDYDYSLFLQNEKMRKKLRGDELKKWNRKFSARVLRHLVNKQETVCSGYAYLLNQLATDAGIVCEVVNGYGRTSQANVGGAGRVNHSWNSVKLRDQWYLCDVTWSSGSYDPVLSKFLRKYDNSYFLAEPSIFIRDHYPVAPTWSLLNDRPSLKEFLKGPLIYSNAFSCGIKQLVPATFNPVVKKGSNLTFNFSGNHKTISKISLSISKGGNETMATPTLVQDESGQFCFDHTFGSKGIHVVHLLVNDRPTVTYRITVK